MAEAAATSSGEMKRSLTLTGVTVNAMALIAPGAFLWTTFQAQSALANGGKSTAPDMWTGLLFALVLALLTAYSYSELARIYPDAGTGSSYYFAEAALLDKASPAHRRFARFAKLSVGWISHLYYWIYPGIMVAFTATLFGYIYSAVFGGTLSYIALGTVAVIFAFVTGYIAYRGISGSTMVSIVILTIQIVSLVLLSIWFIAYRMGNPSCTTSSRTRRRSLSRTALSTCCTSRRSRSCCWSDSSRSLHSALRRYARRRTSNAVS